MTETVHAARRSYSCSACGRTIAAGQRYTLDRRHGDTFPRQWENRRTCDSCQPLQTPNTPPTSTQIGLFP